MNGALPQRIAGRAVVGARRVGGGSINAAFRVELEGGGAAFVKTRPDAAPGEYAAEAAGLAWLADGGARVPEVLEAADGWLALAWLDEGRLDARGEEELGRMLARMHLADAEAFGARPGAGGGGGELRIGAVVLPAATGDAWPRFYAEHRLLPLHADAGLTRAGARAVEEVCARIDALAGPPEPPARLHGDLWAGNVLATREGAPVLIDPAAYGGHREVDLAMLALFGAPAQSTLDAYDELHPRAEGHEERVALWQLFPLLVHAVLFGGSYAQAVERAARRYV